MGDTVILYPHDGAVAVTKPIDATIPIMELARGTTPAGVPFILVDENELPDAEYFDAWTADFSEPDGYGIGFEAWAAERQVTPPPFTPTAEVLAVAAENEQKTKEINDALAAALSAQAEAVAPAQSMRAPPAPENAPNYTVANSG